MSRCVRPLCQSRDPSLSNPLFPDVFASLPRGDPGDVFAVLSLLLEAIESGGDPSPG